MITQDSLLELLDVSQENVRLFSVRHSNRAKRLIFKSSIRIGFEIVLPRFYDDNWVLEIVSRRKFKIEKDIIEIREARRELKPKSIALLSTGNRWKVTYRGINHKNSGTVTETSTTLEVPEDPKDVFQVPTLLQKWLHEKALKYLPRQLDGISAALRLPYKKMRVKRQKTLWGSCSIRRNINLNRNLMLLPPDVVDYVLHHELVHLKVLNHSSEFWKELERLFPSYRKSLSRLKCLQNGGVPEWALV